MRDRERESARKTGRERERVERRGKKVGEVRKIADERKKQT